MVKKRTCHFVGTRRFSSSTQCCTTIRLADAVVPTASSLGGMTLSQHSSPARLPAWRRLIAIVWLDHLFQDIRYGGRQLRRFPGFALAAIVTLALGVSANTTAFTLLNSLALRPMPVPNPDRVVRLRPIDATGRGQSLVSYLDYIDYREQNHVFDGLVAYTLSTVTLGARADAPRAFAPPQEVLAYVTSANYFSVFGATPALGRTLLPRDELPGSPPVVVLSYMFWERYFGSGGAVIGETLTLNGRRFQIVGVGPRDFIGTEPIVPDVWVPLSTQGIVEPGADLLHDRRAGLVLMIGRLRPGVSHVAANAEMNALAGRLALAYPAANRTAGFDVMPGTFFSIDPGLRPVIAFALTILALVLLVACANVANLLLARATSRQSEIAVRLALGSTRGRLIRQLLTESLLIALLGSAAGLFASFCTLRVLYPIGVSLLPFRWGTIVLDLEPDVRVFLYTIVLAIGTSIVFGLAPAIQASRPELAAAMHEEGSTVGGMWRRSRLRNALVVVQIAVCLVLLVCAGLLGRALQRAKAVDLGFDAANVVFTEYDLDRLSYSDPAVREFNRRLGDQAANLPGVASIAWASHVPLTGGIRRTTIRIDSVEPPNTPAFSCIYTAVSSRYFATLGMPIIKGRSFAADEVASQAPVAVISAGLARRFWPDQDPLGKRIVAAASQHPLTIIGVVRDSSDGALWREKEMSLYVPLSEASQRSKLHLLVRTAGESEGVITALRGEARALDPNLGFDARPLEEVLRLWILPSRVAAIAAAALGFLALVMASLGTYAVLAFVVGRRTREIGVRVALGAGRRDVLRLVMLEGVQLIALGVATGLVGSIAMARALRSVLFDLHAIDAITFIGVPLLLSAVALLACYFPARRAARVDPMIALRWE
jgi:putative ABC transport system permease protein